MTNECKEPVYFFEGLEFAAKEINALLKKIANLEGGIPGEDGKSAYEIAVENGYDGTVEQWLLSLRGPKFTFEDFTEENIKELQRPALDAVNERLDQIADNEDLVSMRINHESRDLVLKFADRTYLPSNFSGKGYKILRKNIGTVIDFDAITDVIHVAGDINPTSDIMEGTYDGDVENVVINTTLKEVYGVVSVKVGLWGAKSTYYKNWTGTVNYDRSKFCTEDGKPLENGIYCIGKIRPYKKYVAGNFITYNIENGAPSKMANILRQKDVSEANTIYEVRYDYTNNFETISIGENSVLKFVGGSFSNLNIKFNNTIIENNSNNCIFYNVNVDSYGYLSNDFIYDYWHNDIFGYDVIRSIKGLILTKDYIISDMQHFEQGVSNTNYNKYKRSLFIEGQGHEIKVESGNFTKKSGFLSIEKIFCRNLTLIDNASDQQEHISSFFNSAIGIFENVKFKGYCRLIANWSFWGTSQKDTMLHIYNCKMETTSFIAEHRFDNVEIINSYLSGRPDIRWDYMRDILSIAGSVDEENIDNAKVLILNSVIIGSWELAGFTLEDKPMKGMYKTIDIFNSYLKYFKIGAVSSEAYSNTNETILTYKNCTLDLALTGGEYNGLTEVNFEQCNITFFDENLFGMPPIEVTSVKSFSMIDCNINLCKKNVGIVTTDPTKAPYEQKFYFENVNISSINSVILVHNSLEGIENAEWCKQHITDIVNCSINFKFNDSDVWAWNNNIKDIGCGKVAQGAYNRNYVLLPFRGIVLYTNPLEPTTISGDTYLSYLKYKNISRLPIYLLTYQNSKKHNGFNTDLLYALLCPRTNQILYNGHDVNKYLEL